MWTLVTTLLLSSLCCGSAQILFKNIKSATVTDCEKDVVIPCHATNMEPESLEELYLVWFFGKTRIFSFDGSKNTYSKIPAFQSGRISTSAFLKGDASLTLNKNEAKAGNYTCEVTELSREGKQMVELKYSCSKTQILFENITSVTITDCIKNVIIPCTVSNINAKDIKELSVRWIFGKTLILTFEGHSNTYSKIPTFKSAQISTSAFLKGDASLTLDTNEAKAGNYTCEVKELSREGRHTVELKYHCTKLLFKNIKSLMIRNCEKVVIIPCYISSIKAEDIKELSLKWSFEKTRILTFGGHSNTYTKIPTFKSARISIPGLLKGNASLTLDRNEAKVGSYTCEVKQLNREGRHTVKLKQHRGSSWFPLREYILIIIFPFLTSLLFWAQFAILMQKYESNISKRKIIVLSTSGLLFTLVVIFGASHFIPGDFSEKKSNGLIFLVIPSVIPVFLQYHKFMPAIGRTLHAMIILTVIQALGSALAVVGLYFSVNECAPKYGFLVVSGLFIVTLVELLGLIYMKWLDPQIGLNET
uniref:leukocyte surface antigen CD47-like isoform X1 n=1 Tax=Myodes glareolus TaxID=447135 RepID=UPI00202119D8|nr:leukocyte surface antigen CD47-like isoform X1 [Myodes glareolus]